jgi:DNA-binding response OmpR family regulator
MASHSQCPTLFICESDHGPKHPLVAYLAGKNFDVRCIQESSQAIDQIITHAPDIVLLGADLPMAGGYEVISAVRPYYSGHIIFQGRDRDETAELLAFERGADDYILASTAPALLTARISAHLKRGRGRADNANDRQIRVGDLVVDSTRREVSLAERPVDLTTMQFELLWYLAKRSGRVVSRQELYEALYREKYNGFDRSVDVYISRIRHQLGDNAESPRYLKTVRGVGYLFVGNNSCGN